MIAATLVAASLAAAQPTPASPPVMDHVKLEHGKPGAEAKMSCCKDVCSCCAKKDKPAA